MSMPSIRALAAAVAMQGFMGAQRLDSKALLSERRVDLAFDPGALLRGAAERMGIPLPKRGRNAKRRRRHYTNSRPAHCGAKQCAKYARQAQWNDINRYWRARMEFIERRRAAGDRRYL